ncbi:MAG: hypothetical protein K6U87_09790 [Firmicutes bacterium]|nr:hypothetical protein [Bacillota bacterium]
MDTTTTPAPVSRETVYAAGLETLHEALARLRSLARLPAGETAAEAQAWATVCQTVAAVVNSIL